MASAETTEECTEVLLSQPSAMSRLSWRLVIAAFGVGRGFEPIAGRRDQSLRFLAQITQQRLLVCDAMTRKRSQLVMARPCSTIRGMNGPAEQSVYTVHEDE